ncbi:hypothetical protein HLK59_50245 [Streptomyces sp. S3(2020)]|nr:hypothetical protein [Streptomyces sp. S3(2020)]
MHKGQAIGRTAPALSLSDAECARLAPLLTPWFERGATDDVVRHALTSGLPSPVHSAVALVHARLTSKLPAEPPAARPPRRILECAECGVPGRPGALPGGVCGGCRDGLRAPERPAEPLPAPVIHARAAEIRAAMALKQRERTPV